MQPVAGRDWLDTHPKGHHSTVVEPLWVLRKTFWCYMHIFYHLGRKQIHPPPQHKKTGEAKYLLYTHLPVWLLLLAQQQCRDQFQGGQR